MKRGAERARRQHGQRQGAVFDADQIRLDRAAPRVFDIRNDV
jgi:hypothetical protein